MAELGKRAQVGKELVKLAAALVKHQAKVLLGDEAVGILAQQGATVMGDQAAAKVASLIDDEDKANRILEAFNVADACFAARSENDRFRQAIHSLPLAGIASLQSLALHLPETLDDAALLTSLRERFAADWHGQFTDQELDAAAALYRDCLDRALATKCAQVLPTLVRATWRIDETTRQNLVMTREILSAVQAMQATQLRGNAAQSRHFFDGYLERYRDIFAGREFAFKCIADFLAEPQGGYLVITAPAGFGKTALLANLIRNVRPFFAYYFFTPALRDSLREGFFLRSLVLQLAEWLGRKEDPADEARLPELAATYNEYFKTEFDGAPVLVLDGLDEVTGWDVAQYLLRPTRDLHVIVSVRDVGQDWARQYGLSTIGYKHLRLEGLDRDGVAAVLRKAGAGARAVADNSANLDQVVRVAAYAADTNLGADPFYVRILAEDLASGELQPGDLDRQPPGLERYLDKWWEEIKEAAGDAPVKDIFGTLVAALGPITRNDLERINSSLVDDWATDKFDEVLRRVRRFVLRDPDAAYTLAHPRLREYLRTRVRWEPYSARLLAYCEKWREHKAKYALLHLPAHLLAAGLLDDLCTLLCDFQWLESKLEVTDVSALIEDYAPVHGMRSLESVRDALLLSAHVLVHDKPQLAAQLTARLLQSEDQDIRAMLEQARRSTSTSWLRPLRASLQPPGARLVRTLEGHAATVRAVAVTADGRRAISGSVDHTLKVWDLEDGHTIWTLKDHTRSVYAVALTQDGRRAVSGSADGTLKVWDMTTGALVRTLEGHTQPVYAVAVTVDGRLVISGSRDRTVKVWDLESGTTLRTLHGHEDTVTCVAVAADGRWAVSGSRDSRLNVWDLDSGTRSRTLLGHSGWITTVAVIDTGRRAISGSADKELKIWDLDNGVELQTLRGHEDSILGVAVHADHRKAISASADWTVRLWDLDGGSELATLRGHTAQVESAAFSPDGRQAVSGSDDTTLRLWDVATADKANVSAGQTDPITSAAATADGLRAIAGSSQGTMTIWHQSDAARLRQFRAHDERLQSIVLTSDGRRAISASWDRTLKVWDLESGAVLHTLTGHTGSVQAVAVTRDGERAVSGSVDGTLKLWDLDRGAELRSLSAHRDWVQLVKITPDGRKAISGSDDATLKVWDLATGRQLCSFDRHVLEVTALALTQDGACAVSGSRDGLLKVWELASGAQLKSLEGHTDTVTAVAITPDGRQVVSGSHDGMLKVWDLDSGAEPRMLIRHVAPVVAVMVTGNGRHMISASADRTVRVWELATGMQITSFTADGELTTCDLALNGELVVSGDATGSMHILQLELRD